MKLLCPQSQPDPGRLRHAREGGSAVVVSLILTSILLIFVASNVSNLRQLRRELQLIDQRQVQRLQGGVVTNRPPSAPTPVAGPR